MNIEQTRPRLGWSPSSLRSRQCGRLAGGLPHWRGVSHTGGPSPSPVDVPARASPVRESLEGLACLPSPLPLVHIQKEGRCPDLRTSFNHQYFSTVWPQAERDCGGGYWETAQTTPSKTNSWARSLPAPGLPSQANACA